MELESLNKFCDNNENFDLEKYIDDKLDYLL